MENRTLHNQETFIDYLLFIGYTPEEIERIGNRIAAQKGTKEDYELFYEYIATDEGLLKHINDL